MEELREIIKQRIKARIASYQEMPNIKVVRDSIMEEVIEEINQILRTDYEFNLDDEN